MAKFAYFADLPDGTVLEWRDRTVLAGHDNKGFARYREERAKVGMYMPNANPEKGNRLCGYHPDFGSVEITRQVKLTANPSLHECDARCLNATARVMNCECSCGGKNHGRGRFQCVEA